MGSSTSSIAPDSPSERVRRLGGARHRTGAAFAQSVDCGCATAYPSTMPKLISDESRRVEPPASAAHFHVWHDAGLVLIAQPPRFGSRAAARKAAIRAGLDLGTFEVKACALPCRFTVKRRRKRKPRRKCRHCGKVP